MTDSSREPERPLAAVRRTLDRSQAALVSALRHGRAELESRLSEAEARAWARERTVQELEGYLARIAALVGVEVGQPANWDAVVAVVSDVADRAHRLHSVAEAIKVRAEEAAARSRRAQSQVTGLARIAARFGLATTDPEAILRAIDRARQG